MAKLREQIESRVAHWLRAGRGGPVAAMHPGVIPTGQPAGGFNGVDLGAEMGPEQLQNLAAMALDALRRKGKGKRRSMTRR